MKRKIWLILVMIFAFFSIAFASANIKLFINGKYVNLPVKLIDGEPFVPLPKIYKYIGLSYSYDRNNNRVYIKTEKIDSINAQLNLLYQYVYPKSPDEAVEKWAYGVKYRNGALQYAVLSPSLKNIRKASYERVNWVTGVSSPWVDSYDINKLKEDEYEVTFHLKTSTGPYKDVKIIVRTKKYGDYYFVKEIIGDERIITGI